MPILVLPFPAISPELISFGPFAIRWYALAYIAGLIFGWWYLIRMVSVERLWGRIPRPTRLDIDDLLLWMTLGVVLGGRLAYVLFYDPAHYLADPVDALRIWRGGMSFHGGMTGAAVAMILFARRRGLDFWPLFDMAAAAVPVGLFFGRLANFIRGELYGRVTDVPWAFIFPDSDGQPRHPSQLYEAGLEGLLLGIILTLAVWRFGALRRPGLVTGLFGIGYAVSRIIVENYREPDPQLGFLFGGWLTMGMTLSGIMLLAGLAILVRALRRPAG